MANDKRNKLMEFQGYFESSLDELDTALARVQDAWFCVGEVLDDDCVYNDAYPFGEDDMNEVMTKVWEWAKVCKEKNSERLVTMFGETK